MSPVNLSRIQSWIDAGRLDATKPITLRELTSSGVIHGIKDGIKLLAAGADLLKTPIHIVVSKASQAAIEAVEKAGGTVTTRFYTPQAIRRIKVLQMHPYVSLKWDQTALASSNPVLAVDGGDVLENKVKGMGYTYRLPDPSGRKDIEYYRDAKNRGYLSHTVKEGESASLYFKPHVTEEEIKELKRKHGKRPGVAKQGDLNKLW
jgi:large subunit ribosomal protein L15